MFKHKYIGTNIRSPVHHTCVHSCIFMMYGMMYGQKMFQKKPTGILYCIVVRLKKYFFPKTKDETDYNKHSKTMPMPVS
jgi:hypothetical protein